MLLGVGVAGPPMCLVDVCVCYWSAVPDGACTCRAGLFLQHVVTFMAMPKLSQEARNIWIDRWHKVDSGLGERIESQLKEAMSG